MITRFFRSPIVVALVSGVGIVIPGLMGLRPIATSILIGLGVAVLVFGVGKLEGRSRTTRIVSRWISSALVIFGMWIWWQYPIEWWGTTMMWLLAVSGSYMADDH